MRASAPEARTALGALLHRHRLLRRRLWLDDPSWPGLDVPLPVSGVARALADDIDNSAYRVNQEALTNVALHARIDYAELETRASDSMLGIGIEDHCGGRSPADEAEGSGLASMSARASAVGETLRFGPTASGVLVQPTFCSDR